MAAFSDSRSCLEEDGGWNLMIVGPGEKRNNDLVFDDGNEIEGSCEW